MEQKTVSLADAKARLSELMKQAEAGDEIVITKRGRPVGRLVPPDRPRKPVDLAALRKVTDGMTLQTQSADEFTREMRDANRY